MRRVLGQDPRLNSGIGSGCIHTCGRVCERMHKGLDMGWGFSIVAAVFRLVCCDEAPGVDLFCLRGSFLGETKV